MKKKAGKRDKTAERMRGKAHSVSAAIAAAASVAVSQSPVQAVVQPSPPAPLVDFAEVPQDVLKKLLVSKSIHDGNVRCIAFGTDVYAAAGEGLDALSPMTAEFLQRKPYAVRTRVEKSREAQSARTKRRAEVFTPSWLCKKMVDFLDAEIMSARDAKSESEFSRAEHVERVEFDWRKYVDVRVLEITCGEAPFIVSRYDAATGEPIPVKDRIGVLDRKLRAVNEYAADEAEWMKWAVRAYESVYGYEYQGDSLAIARFNLLATFEDDLKARWGRKATARELTAVANRIAWNFWQMDGLTGTAVGRDDSIAPYLPGFDFPPAEGGSRLSRPPPVQGELDFENVANVETANANAQSQLDIGNIGTGNISRLATFSGQPSRRECFIFDWRARRPVKYNDIGAKGATTMKFDYAIGNPPYQEDVANEGDRANPVYDDFMNETYKVADRVELITPARFLFNAGQTSKAWNKKMLEDPHLKVLEYTQRSDAVFQNTDIKGGVVITYRDSMTEFGKIGAFTSFPELNEILHKVMEREESNAMFDSIVSSQGIFHFSAVFLKDNPKVASELAGKGTGTKIVSKEFETLPNIFLEKRPTKGEYIELIGRLNGKRVSRHIRRSWLDACDYLDCYKVFVPEANGTGALGEVLSTPLIGEPLIGSTDTFISVGQFSTSVEAKNCMKYIKTRFARVMLGVLKATQHNTKSTWRYVPLQDFTSASDIDWTKSVREIDAQLYRKYGLTKDEIKFIEEKVKEME